MNQNLEALLSRMQNCESTSTFLKELEQYIRKTQGICIFDDEHMLIEMAKDALKDEDYPSARRALCILAMFYPSNENHRKHLFLFAYCLFKEKKIDDAVVLLNKLLTDVSNFDKMHLQTKHLLHHIQNNYHMETI